MLLVDVGLHLAIFPTDATSRQISEVFQALSEHLTSQSKRLEIEEALVWDEYSKFYRKQMIKELYC